MNKLRWLAVGLAMMLPLTASAFVGYDVDSDPLYGYSDSTHTSDADSPRYDMSLLSGAGTAVTFSGATVMVPFPIGFSFVYYEMSYDEVYISPYGLLGFESFSSSSSPSVFPSASTPNNVIAGAWYPWTVSSTRASYAVRGTAPAREFVVEYALSGGGMSTTMQVVLEEGSGDVVVYINSATGGWSTMQIGIENGDGSRGISAYYTSPSSSALSNHAVVFSPMGDRPRVRVLTSDRTMDEGGELELNISVTDRNDDVDTITWDFDGDGEFDDGEGESVLIPGTHSNGPGTIAPIVRVDDLAGNVRIMDIVCDIRNAPPEFNTPPVTEILRGQEWTYMPDVVDPGGDDMTIEVVERPAGVTVLPGGGLRWTPNEDDVGDHVITISAVDEDDDPEITGDGDAEFEFTLTVLDNTAPPAPRIIRPNNLSTVDTLRPTFEVETPIDPEGDTLFLFFDVDTTDTFNSPNLITSGQIPATRGTTGWTITDELEDGQRYRWRVYAFDGHDEGFAASASFDVDLGTEPEDGGPDAGEDAGPEEDGGGSATVTTGCNVTSTTGPAVPVTVLIVVGLVLGLLRRKES